MQLTSGLISYKGRLSTEHYQLQSNNMNFYLIGSLEGFNDLRFPNVEDWQNCMGHAEGLLKQWNPPEMEYIWKKSNRHKHFDLSQFCNPLLTISDKALSILENILIKNGEILDIKSPKGFYFFHCTNIIDALIEKESDIVWLDKERGWVSCINKFVLDKNKIQEQTIFRLPNVNCRYTFYGEEFKNLVLKHHLQGIHFDRYETIIIK